jgi:hypothetical protein
MEKSGNQPAANNRPLFCSPHPLGRFIVFFFLLPLLLRFAREPRHAKSDTNWTTQAAGHSRRHGRHRMANSGDVRSIATSGGPQALGRHGTSPRWPVF